MEKNTVKIIFSDNNRICYAGNFVNGSVKLSVGNPIKVKEILLNIRGEANVLWKEGNITYIAKEKYFNNIINILQKQEGQKEDITFQEGVYNYPFSIQLPKGIPSSFQGLYGSVRYEMEVTVVRSWAFNLSWKCPFTVLSVLNLNELPNISRQMVGTDEKTVCCLCCASGSITASITTERQGYVPGEAIKFWAEIKNDSSRNIKYSKAKLIMARDPHPSQRRHAMQTVVYHCGSTTKTINHVLYKLRGQGIPPGRMETLSGQKLFIPPVPSSFLLGCSIINIRYYVSLSNTQITGQNGSLEHVWNRKLLSCKHDGDKTRLWITAVPSGPAFDLVVPVEVIIGAIPILTEGQAFPQPEFKRNEVIQGDYFAPLYPYYNLDRPHPNTNFEIVH